MEARLGRLHVFLPYTPKLPDYLDLVAAVEDTCAHLEMPIWVEGYPPAIRSAFAQLQRHAGSGRESK